MSNERGWVGRTVRAIPIVLQVGLAAALGMGSVGCGALSALTNPKAGWALSEPAPMSVVVRRAEVANATAKQVERLMGKTGVNDASAWIPKTALKKADAEALLGGVATDDTYAGAQGVKLRVVPAEAWVATFSAICSDEGKYPNLLAATSPALAASYKEIAGQQKALAKLKSARAEEDKALDAKDIKADAKADHQKKRDDIDASIAKQEDSYKPKVDAFLAKIKEEAAKADDATKKRVGVAVVNLRRAVGDAKTDNSVALIRYPLAITGLTTDLQSTAKRIVADVIEEKVGKRPIMSGLKPDVSLDGMDVKLTLNGLSASEIGGLNPAEVITETTSRLTSYVGRVLTLVAYADETEDMLSFEADVLDAWIGGFKLDAAKVDGAGDDLADVKIEAGTPAAAKGAKAAPSAIGKHSAAGLRTASCRLPSKEKEDEAAPVVAELDPPKPEKAAEKPAAPKAAKGSAPVPVKTAQASPAPVKSAPVATKAASAKCDMVVTNGDGTTCL